ncbi:MAG: ABC transporter permease, partial [Candidatus Dormibacteraeota bacterium]|nr:ABC transporter permease [Candidatus Dormibacteraeota bacterium]
MSGLWPLVWRAVAARPLRAALTVLAVSLGIAVVLAVQVTVDGLDSEAAAAQQVSAGQSGLDVRVDSGSGLTPAQVSTVAGLPGVAQVVPLHEKRVIASPLEKGFSGVAVTLVGISDGSVALRPVDVISGRLPHPGNLSEVAIDQGLAQALTATPGQDVKLGDRIQLITSTGPDRYIVVGITGGTSGGPSFTR